jgi:hypothetical protein
MITTQKYVRKPLYVDAVRVTSANFDDIVAWCQGEVDQDEVPGKGTKKHIKVRVHNPKNPRQTKAFVGDWLLYTERGYKVYTNKAFHASFDEALSEQPLSDAEYDDPPATSPPRVIEDAKLHSVGPVVANPDPETGVQPILGVGEPETHMTPQGEPIEMVPVTTESIDTKPSVEQEVYQDLAQASDSLEMQRAREIIEGEGGTVETATPQAIADVVNQQQSTVPVDDGIEMADSPTAPPVDVEGKKVISVEEQANMDQTEIRELLQTGEFILAQDLVG